MGYFDADTKEMLGVYMLETRQLTEQLGAVLLEAEKKDFFSEDDIHTVFRIMHTMKSSSAMMGLEALSAAAHKLEDIFGYYREEFGQIVKPEPELFDLLFLAADYIDNELKRMVRDDYVPGDTAELERKISEYLERERSVPDKHISDAQAAYLTVSEAPDYFAGRKGAVVKVTFEPGCRMENIRAFMLIRQIGGLCTDIETYPAELEKSQDSAEFIEKNGVFIRFVSGQKADVLEALENGLFVERCEVLAENKEERELREAERTAKISREPDNAEKSAGTQENEFLNVRTDRLDKLQNMAGEMMIQLQSLENELTDKGLKELREGSVHQISRLIADVERTVMEMRMVPVGRIIPQLKRILRDICRDQKKEADLIVQGADIEADKNVIEYISEAAMHIIRNALDHGIEPPEERIRSGKDKKGKIYFNVESTVGELLVSISDDGAGLDEEKIRQKARKENLFRRPEEEYSFEEVCELILMPGFTTSEAVTEYSGRGVGLDVVKSVLENAGGHIYIHSESGKGSTFTITAPLTLATMECIRFQVEEYRFSLPARYVYHFMEYHDNKDKIKLISGKEYILFEDRLVPFIDLRRFYDFEGKLPESALIVYIKGTKREGCLAVDKMYNQKRIVIKPLPALFGMNFRRNTGMSGCSIKGSGRICIALDTEILIEKYEKEERYGIQ